MWKRRTADRISMHRPRPSTPQVRISLSLLSTNSTRYLHQHQLLRRDRYHMTSIPCAIRLHFPSSPTRLTSPFLAATRSLRWLRATKLRRRLLGSSKGGRARCWFRFGKNGVDSERASVYGSQSRDDFDCNDVEQYYNYMGMLAVEGNYDKMNKLLNLGIHPVDILLLLAAGEGDKPKIEELMRAGARYDVKDAEGRTALDRAASEEIRELILRFSVQNI